MFSQLIEIYNNFTLNYPFATHYIQGLALSLVIWMLYLELNPKLGGIFFRPDSNGISRFRFGGVIPMLTHPFKDTTFWYPSNWDLNFIVSSNIGALIYSMLKM
jgi:hypothetical protein